MEIARIIKFGDRGRSTSLNRGPTVKPASRSGHIRSTSRPASRWRGRRIGVARGASRSGSLSKVRHDTVRGKCLGFREA
ncbi:hypothetical protein BKA56DRAFT_348291 [Ilyonectria sp. MPI-CAGE-AT-0026]|nr:hypothetical protein BKA56DRAFT_348291 [Ilyonectria sp. MPI-CAGE-AT-0026]